MAAEHRGKEDGPGIVELLTQLSKTFNRRSTEDLLGMRLKVFLVLSYLQDHPGTTQQELGDAMLLDPNAVVLLLNELESRGFSVRRRDAEDRRRHVVDITRAGQEAVARAEKAREAIENEDLAHLTAEERRTLRRILLRGRPPRRLRAPSPESSACPASGKKSSHRSRRRHARGRADARVLAQPQLSAPVLALSTERTVCATVARYRLKQVVRSTGFLGLRSLLGFVSGAAEVAVRKSRSDLLAEDGFECAAGDDHLPSWMFRGVQNGLGGHFRREDRWHRLWPAGHPIPHHLELGRVYRGQLHHCQIYVALVMEQLGPQRVGESADGRLAAAIGALQRDRSIGKG